MVYNNNLLFPIAKMEVLSRVYWELIECKIFAGEIDLVNND